MNGVFERQLMRQLHQMALTQRALGQEEFRLAAARMLIEAGETDAARLVLAMLWDEHMTEDERAERQRMPQ